jgi:retron-type reverse transcriptase
LVDALVSLGKRTSIITFSFSGANFYNLDEIFSDQRITLLCGGKRPCGFESLIFKDRFGDDIVFSQGLGGSHFSCGRLKYDYKVGYFSRLGTGRKPLSLRGSIRNVAGLSCSKRDFSGKEESHYFKKLVVYKGKFINLTSIISDVDFLQLSYQKIKCNFRILVPGSSEVISDGLDENWFIKISDRLSNGSYQFEPVRRVMIPKPNKSGFRPFTISGFRDKIVQQAIKMILEEIYEPKFLHTSHGFRPFRGCHSALESIRMNWTGISWFLEFGVEKCYNTMDKHRFISILKENIQDQRFIDLIVKLFNAGIIGWKEGLGPDPSQRVSQDSILLPLLANIYLHKLDLEVASIILEYQKGKRKRLNKDVITPE